MVGTVAPRCFAMGCKLVNATEAGLDEHLSRVLDNRGTNIVGNSVQNATDAEPT